MIWYHHIIFFVWWYHLSVGRISLICGIGSVVGGCFVLSTIWICTYITTRQAISHHLKSMGMIQNQGNCLLGLYEKVICIVMRWKMDPVQYSKDEEIMAIRCNTSTSTAKPKIHGKQLVYLVRSAWCHVAQCEWNHYFIY